MTRRRAGPRWASGWSNTCPSFRGDQWKATTLIATPRKLDHRGNRCSTTVGGAVPNPGRDLFTALTQQVLVPTLRPGQIVVLNNLSSHKVAGVREAI